MYELRDEFHKLQKRKSFLWKMSSNFLYKLEYNQMTYIDYVNMINLKNEIEEITFKCQMIVKDIKLGYIK